MTISIVIPNWNGRDLLEKNLAHVLLAKQNVKNNVKEIIVVDDGSTDDSVKFLKQKYGKEIRVIVHTKNRGFATSVNTGVRMAKGELVCLLNSDVVPEVNFLETIKDDFEDPKVFAVSLHEKGYGYAKGKFKDGFIVHEPVSASGATEVRETFWASGGSSVIRRSLFMELKGV